LKNLTFEKQLTAVMPRKEAVMKTNRIFPLFLLSCLLVMGLQHVSVASSADKWDSFTREFVGSYLKIHPDFAVYLGRHEFDGSLPDWSSEGLKKQAAWLHEQRELASGFGKDSLDARRQIEYELILTAIDGDLFWLETLKSPYHDPTFYSLNPSLYATRAYAPQDVRIVAYIRYAKAVPAAVEQIEKNLQPPFPRTFIDIGKIIYGGVASFCESDAPKAFDGVKDTILQREFHEANTSMIRALNGLSDWLEAQRPTANDSFAIGADHFLEMLRLTEHVNIPLSQLEKIGKQDLARNLKAMKEVCAQFAPGKSIEECIKMVQSQKPQGDLLEAAQRQLDSLRQFIVQNDIVTIPDTEHAYARESPPFMRWNAASIDIPGPFEKGIPSFYYITLPDSSWSKESRENYIPGESDLLFVSVHEVWPGHFLQFLHAHRNPSEISKMFGSYAFIEGWAHYTEEMMWDAGLGKGNPGTHVGQLLEALLRDVRFVSAIGLHTGGMTVQQSYTMFCEQAFQDSANAMQQAVRGTFDPGYLNYTLGKLMIMKLRDDWCATRGGRKAWKEFHDRFLSYGAPPVPLVREMMLGSNNGSILGYEGK
jgi:uncharacterized protein (DUF885 family)